VTERAGQAQWGSPEEGPLFSAPARKVLGAQSQGTSLRVALE
jgi:hypothetical protein